MNRLGHMLRLYRMSKVGIGIRSAAKEIGVSAAMLSRIERGLPCDLRALQRLLEWLTGDVR